jgi:2-C-methyl-D-erythritol 2,4-cyclodiphosphate synthase
MSQSESQDGKQSFVRSASISGRDVEPAQKDQGNEQKRLSARQAIVAFWFFIIYSLSRKRNTINTLSDSGAGFAARHKAGGDDFMRIGTGYDAHRLVSGRTLVLGGVTIPYEKGLDGHSDADVLVHAVCDALLGAAGLGDIGRHFPDTDPAYKGIASIRLLEMTAAKLRDRGFSVINVDATVLAQAPKLAPFMETMAANIAEALDIGPHRVNVKATTTEGMGFVGAGEGMAAMSTALIRETDD